MLAYVGRIHNLKDLKDPSLLEGGPARATSEAHPLGPLGFDFKHFALPWTGPAAEPCVLSDHSKGRSFAGLRETGKTN